MPLPIECRAPVPPEPDRKEILRYLRARELSEEEEVLLAETLSEQLPLLEYRAVFARLPFPTELFDVGKTLSRRLCGCESVLLFAATVGAAPDRLVARYRRISPARALFHQAVGAERAEALCDRLCRDLSAEFEKEGLSLLPRFSPGYADFSLTEQKKIFDLLDLPRRAGISLTENCLMIPTKSVTGVIGLIKEEKE